MLQTVRNGLSKERLRPDIWKPEQKRSNALYQPNDNPLYKSAIRNGVREYDFPTNGLVLYAPLYLCRGSKFKSVDLYRHSCTVTGAVWGSTGRTFDGIDDNINLGNISTLNFERTDPFSVFAWVKRTTNGATHFIAGKRGSDVPYRGWNIVLSSDNKFRFELCNAVAGSLYLSVASNSTFTDTNANLFLAATYSGSGLTTGVLLYSAGVLLADTDEVNTLGSNTIQSTNNFAIGSRNAAVSVPLAGIMGEVWVYSRALSVGEILHIYNTSKWRYV